MFKATGIDINTVHWNILNQYMWKWIKIKAVFAIVTCINPLIGLL